MIISKEELMDHYKFPRNRKDLTNPDFCSDDLNPSCGDKIKIEGRIDNETITDIGFCAHGCILSQASTSILVDECEGRHIDDVLLLTKEDLLSKIGVPLGPTRVKCALLCLDVLRTGIARYKEQKNSA